MELLVGIVTGLIILVFLVVIHELGHAIAARRSGVVVEEFGIGFPPKAWAKRLKNGVLFSLNWLPLGGFVKLQGEHDAADKKGDYGAATFWQKTKILLAGVVINWLMAAVLLTGLAAVGLPRILPNQFSVAGDTSVVSGPVTITIVGGDTPAEEAGLRAGDEIISFGGRDITTSEELVEQTRARSGEEVDITYARDGKEHVTSAVLRSSNEDGEGYLGVGSGQQELQRSTWSAPIVGIGTTAQLSWLTLEGISDLFANLGKGLVSQLSFDEETRERGSQSLQTAGDNVAGPIGILGVIFPQAQQAGLTQIVLLTAIISLTLAVINALPIPALDGGRWFVTALFRLMKKPLGKDLEEKIHATGFMLLMVLVILVTVVDVNRFF